MTTITCSASGCSSGEVLGETDGGPEAAWGYLCGPCAAAWEARRAENPQVDPYTLLELRPR